MPMITSEVKRLWRVVWVHRNGYRAPVQYVWAKVEKRYPHIEKRFVTEWAKENSRLSAFPKEWYYKLTALEVYDPPVEKREARKGLSFLLDVAFRVSNHLLYRVLFSGQSFDLDLTWMHGTLSGYYTNKFVLILYGTA